METLVVELGADHYRYALSRVRFNAGNPVVYHMALKGDEDLSQVEEGIIFGFVVDAGLVTLVDVATRDAYCDFEEGWYAENPGTNIYDDFFAHRFLESYQANPEFQRELGDWINFEIPGTGLRIPMIQSGYGDGLYPVYFGYDAAGNLCDVVIEFIYLGD